MKQHPSNLNLAAKLIAFIAFCFWVVAPSAHGQKAGSASVNINDTGVQVGRVMSGVSAAPAAFTGSERPDTASFDMRVPLLSLPGRGLNVDLDLNYNSSLYQQSYNGKNNYIESTVKHNLRYPGRGFSLGYGMLVGHAGFVVCERRQYGSCSTQSCYNQLPTVESYLRTWTYFTPDGSRHRLQSGISVDGSDLRLTLPQGQPPHAAPPVITYPNGTKVYFTHRQNHIVDISETFAGNICDVTRNAYCTNHCTVYDWVYVPTKIVDRNGNTIQINYVANNDIQISSIKDTLGRIITFRYDSQNRIQSVSVPGYEDETEREVARFYPKTIVQSLSFADQNSYNQNINVLEYVVLPGTGTGWHYEYSSYGMIYRVEKRGGMEIDGNTGQITNYGQVIASTEYNYNGTPLNPTTNLLFKLPGYTRRTDDWMGNPGAPVVHEFAVGIDTVERVSKTYITAPGGTVSEIKRRWYHANQHSPLDWRATWDEGLIQEAKIDNGGKTYARVINSWSKTEGGPRLLNQTIFNDAGQQTKTVYDYYDGPALTNGVYNGVFCNVKTMTQFGFNIELLKRTEYTYEDRPDWTSRWLVKLQKSVKVYEGISTSPVSQVDYVYDEHPLESYDPLPDTYDTTTPAKRGNVTSVINNTNAANPATGVDLTITKHYDVFGNNVKSVDAIGNATTDPDDHVAKTEFSAEYKHAYPTRVISPVPDAAAINGSASSLITTNSYNFNTGLQVTATDANQQTTTSTYTSPNDSPNAHNRLRKVARPDGGETSYEYSDEPGNVFVRTKTLRESSPAEKVQDSYEYYDALGRSTRTYSYDGTESVPWIGVETKYDVFGRAEQTSNPVRVASHGGAISTSNWTVTSFDTLSRPLTVTTPGGAKVHTAYLGSKTMATDQAGKSRRRETDALGRLVQVVEFRRLHADPAVVQEPDANDYLTFYEYDVLGNLKKVRQGEVVGQGCAQGCQERAYAYDSLSRRTSVSNPESGTISFTYDENGNLKERTDNRKVRATYKYDALNRIIRRSYEVIGGGTPDGFSATEAVDFYYDGKGIPAHITIHPDSKGAAGKLTASKSDVSDTINSGFDAMGRIIASAQVTRVPDAGGQPVAHTYLMQYEFDLSGNLKEETYPTGRKVAHTYDEGGRIAAITGTRPSGTTGDTYASSFGYTTFGKVASVRLGNGLWEHVKYNARSQPIEIGMSTAGDQSADRLKLEYKYGLLVDGALDPTKNNGNIQSQIITVQANGNEPGVSFTQDYEYDELNRLRMAQENTGANWKQTFDYDKYGNREFNAAGTTDSVEKPQLGINKANNRITAAGYVYDPAGNLKDEPGHTYKYDAEGRLTEHDGGAAPTNPAGGTFSYDGDGRRVKKAEGGATTVFVYNALGQLVAEYATAVQYRGTNYVLPDHLDNTRVVTNAVGSVVSRHDYLPFGEEIQSYIAGGRQSISSYNPGTIRQKYASKERDAETGLDYFGARYYSSSQGRFTSPDTPLLDQMPENPQSWNLYTYTRNNPVRVPDRNGQITPWDVLDVVSVVISLYDFYQEPSLENAAWLAGDLIGAALPLVPFGSVRRGWDAVDTAADLLDLGSTVSKADEVGDAGRFMFQQGDDIEIPNYSTGLLRQDADPLRATYGPAHSSHPEEYQRTMEELRQAGVDISFREGKMAYSPSAGEPGRMIFDPDGSIGALRHETKHFNDVRDMGYPGLGYFMENPDEFWRLEYRGYMEEVRFARSQRDFGAARQLVGIMRQVRTEILGGMR